MFDTLIPFQYNEQDRRAGYYFGKDRRGQLHRVPLMTLSIGIVTNQHRRFAHPAQVSELATEMKSYAKTQAGSVFVVDRRRDQDPEEGGRDGQRERDLSVVRDGVPRRPRQAAAAGVRARCACATMCSPYRSRRSPRRSQRGDPPAVAAPPASPGPRGPRRCPLLPRLRPRRWRRARSRPLGRARSLRRPPRRRRLPTPAAPAADCPTRPAMPAAAASRAAPR